MNDSLNSSGSNEAHFTPIEDIFEPLPEEPESTKVEPFTGEEIARGIAFAVAFGLRFKNEEELKAFEKAFMKALPFMPTPAVLDLLGVGEALAAYGIHKGMVGGPEALESLPPWLRLLLGAGYIAFAVYTDIRAVKEVSGGEKTQGGGLSAGADSPGNSARQEVPGGPFQTAQAL